MNRGTDSRKSLWMFISSMLIFGTIGIFRRHIPLSSGLLTFSRGILGGLFLLVFLRLQKKDTARLAPRDLRRFALTGAMIGINWILLFEAYNHTTVAVATLCYYMQPTIVILLSPLVFRERITGRKALCAVVSIIGMVLVSGVVGQDGLPGGSWRGILLGLGAAVFYAFVVIMNKKVQEADAYQRTTVQLLFAGLVMIPYLLVTGDYAVGEISLAAVLLVLVVGIVHTGLAYVLYFRSMSGLSVQKVSVFSYIDPVSALFFSALFLREPLTPLNLIGAVLIIGSAVLA